jgi:hypothetical protein
MKPAELQVLASSCVRVLKTAEIPQIRLLLRKKRKSNGAIEAAPATAT